MVVTIRRGLTHDVGHDPYAIGHGAGRCRGKRGSSRIKEMAALASENVAACGLIDVEGK